MANKKYPDHHRLAREEFIGSYRLHVPKWWWLFLSHEAADFLAYMAEVADIPAYHVYDKSYAEGGGWFYCTVRRVEVETRYTRKIQIRLLNELKSRRVVELEYRGWNAVRYIRILWGDLRKWKDKVGETNMVWSSDSDDVPVVDISKSLKSIAKLNGHKTLRGEKKGNIKRMFDERCTSEKSRAYANPKRG